MNCVRLSSAAEPNRRQSNNLGLVHYVLYIGWELVAPATLLGHRLELERKELERKKGCSTAFILNAHTVGFQPDFELEPPCIV